MDRYQKLDLLKSNLKKLGSLAIAFSGGVDSTFLLKVAYDTLGENAIAITIKGIMHSSREIEEAKEYAKEIGAKHVLVPVEKFDVKEFIDNDPLRCYYCKTAVFTNIKNIAESNNIIYVADGTNIDDLGDYRPGMKALQELDIISPLKEAGMTKEDIRMLSKDLELETFDKPSFACLASRIPYGEKITNEKLRMVEKCEDYLLKLGFKQFRVRCHLDIARIEVSPDEISKFFDEDFMKQTHDEFQRFGFKYVTLDMFGYRTGSMNEVLDTNN